MKTQEIEPTAILEEEKFEIHVFGDPLGALAIITDTRLRKTLTEVEQGEELQTLRRLKNIYEDLGLEFLSAQQDNKIREITERLRKEIYSSLNVVELKVYVEFPRELLEAFWTYKSLSEHRTPIPSKVLKIWRRVKNGGMLQSFSIWYNKKGDKEDNLLIAPAYFIDKIFLLVRWGEKLRPLEELGGEA